MAVQTDYRYQVWVTGTFRKKGKRPVLIGDDLDGLREYVDRQRVKCQVRTMRTGTVMYPRPEKGRG